MLDPASAKGMQNYWSADFLAELPDEAVDALVEHATKPVSQLTQIILVVSGVRPRAGASPALRPLRAGDGRRRDKSNALN